MISPTDTNVRKALLLFEEILCKEISSNSLQAATKLVHTHPQLSQQFIRLAINKDRLDILLVASEYITNEETTIRVLNYLCKQMALVDPRQASLLWNRLYCTSPNPKDRFKIYYQSLMCFPFGGANRQAQTNALLILRQMIDWMHQRGDNQLLSQVFSHYILNFNRFNILAPSYFQVMNKILEISSEFGGYMQIEVHQLMNRYVIHLEEAKKKVWHGLMVEILKGIAILAQVVVSQEYIVGSIHEMVLFHIHPYLEDTVFGVRDAARLAVRSWKLVEHRVQKDDTQKRKLREDTENIFRQEKGEPVVLEMINKVGKYLAKKEYVSKKAESELAERIKESQLIKKQFLKRHSGNGGGYITLQKQRRHSRPKYRYEQVLKGVMARQPPHFKLVQEEHEWYPNNSHLTRKYDLEETVEYSLRSEGESQELLSQAMAGESLSVKQIEDLIDLAYSRM